MDPVSEMIGLYRTWSQQLVDGYSKGLSVTLDEGDIDSILFCGMGGSGITGDFIKAHLDEESSVFSYVVKDFSIPRWVNEKTLVFGISYSGNTVETLRCVKDSLERKASIITISSGGKLLKLARDKQLKHVALDKGYYPRTALAQMVGSVIGVLSNVLSKTYDNLIHVTVERLSAVNPESLRETAYNLRMSDLIVIATGAHLEPLARRFRSELSENTKVIAKEEVYPESGHNDIVSWQENHEGSIGFIVISVKEKSIYSKILDSLKSVYARHGVVEELSLQPASKLTLLLEGSLMGGYLSVYLAGYRGVDPRDTSIINIYKDIVGRTIAGT